MNTLIWSAVMIGAALLFAWKRDKELQNGRACLRYFGGAIASGAGVIFWAAVTAANIGAHRAFGIELIFAIVSVVVLWATAGYRVVIEDGDIREQTWPFVERRFPLNALREAVRVKDDSWRLTFADGRSLSVNRWLSGRPYFIRCIEERVGGPAGAAA